MPKYERQYFYLHSNGELIERNAYAVEFGGGASEYFNSPFCVKWWKIDSQEEYDKMKKELDEIKQKGEKE